MTTPYHSMADSRRGWGRTSLSMLALILLAWAGPSAQNGTVAPIGVQQFFDNSGLELSGGKLYWYDCGGVVNRTVYSDKTLSTAYSQPIVLNSAGRPPSNGAIFLTPGICHKLVVTTSADVELYSVDNIGPGHGVGDDRLRLSPHSATIATGVITATYSQYEVDTEDAAIADDLSTITAGTGIGEGSILVLTPANVARVVTVVGSGNIRLAAGEYRLDATGSSLTLYYDGSNWIELARGGGSGATVVTSTSTGTQADFNPGILGGLTVIRMTNATQTDITGFAAGVDGQRLLVLSLGAGLVNVYPQNSGSVAANRIINYVTSGPTPLSAGTGQAAFVYDGTTDRWRMTHHAQGAWMTATFNEDDFTGDGTDANWELDAADRGTLAYHLSGRLLTVSFAITATDIANTPTTLRILNGQWGGYTITKDMQTMAFGTNAGTTREAFKITATAAGTDLRFEQLDAGTFTNTTSDNTAAIGQIAFEID